MSTASKNVKTSQPEISSETYMNGGAMQTFSLNEVIEMVVQIEKSGCIRAALG